MGLVPVLAMAPVRAMGWVSAQVWEREQALESGLESARALAPDQAWGWAREPALGSVRGWVLALGRHLRRHKPSRPGRRRHSTAAANSV